MYVESPRYVGGFLAFWWFWYRKKVDVNNQPKCGVKTMSQSDTNSSLQIFNPFEGEYPIQLRVGGVSLGVRFFRSYEELHAYIRTLERGLEVLEAGNRREEEIRIAMAAQKEKRKT